MNLNNLNMNAKIEELLSTLNKKEEEKEKNTVLWVLAIIGAVAAVAGIAFAVYRFFTPDYLEDFEEDLDDDFDDYFLLPADSLYDYFLLQQWEIPYGIYRFFPALVSAYDGIRRYDGGTLYNL